MNNNVMFIIEMSPEFEPALVDPEELAEEFLSSFNNDAIAAGEDARAVKVLYAGWGNPTSTMEMEGLQ